MANNYALLVKPETIAALQAAADKATPAPEPEHSMIRNVRRRLGQATLDEIVRRYQAGEHSTALMAEYKVGKSTMLRLLRSSGVSMRRQGLTLEQQRLAPTLYESGLSIQRVADRIGASSTTVQNWLLASGVRLRARPGR